MNVQDFFNQDKIIDLSFFNFENAITAAYYANENLEVQKVNKNFVDIDIHREQNLNQITNIRKNNIVIGDFRKLFEENYNIIPDTIFYHNPYVNRMWSKIETYHLVK